MSKKKRTTMTTRQKRNQHRQFGAVRAVQQAISNLRAHSCVETRPVWLGLLLLLVLWSSQVISAISPSEIPTMLDRAEEIKRKDFATFTRMMGELENFSNRLTTDQRHHVQYLRAWQQTYAGELDTAIEGFKLLLEQPVNQTLRLRTMATLMNALTIASRYEEAFVYFEQLTAMVPSVSDQNARAQAYGVGALLYNQVKQYELGLEYAEKMRTASNQPWVVCAAVQYKFHSLFSLNRLTGVTPELESWIARCKKDGEHGPASLMLTYVARLHILNGRAKEAIAVLQENRAQMESTLYRWLISINDAVLAQAYWKEGDLENARLYAQNAVDKSVPNQLTEPLIDAYRMLFEIAKSQGNYVSALELHQKYMAADKAYLDDVSARQLAYQMAQQQSVANKLQIEALNQQNQVLQLKQDLDAKAVQNSRLSIALLLAFLAFIALWAYKTKRSQLHFMRQAQHDSLTGIFNRHHFIQLSEIALDSARRTRGSCSVVIIDLDHFKIINDAHGHAAGDTVLRQAVTACRQLLGHNDIFGRLGGEEFGLMLPDRDAEAAMHLAEKCRLAIAETDTGDGRDEFPISASFGVTSTAVSGFKLQQLLAHADSALYLAKRQGRNRVELYKGGPTHPGPASKEFSAAH
jgi:diguanylate cyclase (GGDEF)-like protein